jgi:O-antigen/teichoic acid export membrane protein
MLGKDFLVKVSEIFVTRVLVIAIGMLFMVIVARVLGPEGRGLYAIIVTIVAIAVQLCNFGLHVSSVYFVSREGTLLLPSLIGNAIAVTIVVSIPVACLLYGLSLFAQQVVPLDGIILALVVLAVPAGLLLLIFLNLLLGVNLVRQYNVTNLLIKLVSIALLGTLVLSGSASVSMVYTTVLIGGLAGVTFSYRHLTRQCQSAIRISFQLFDRTFRYGIKAYLAALFSFLVIKQDILMVQYFMGQEHVGYYSIAGEMAEQLMLLSAVVSAVLFPALSAIEKQKHRWRTTKQVLCYIALAMGGIVSVAAFLSEPIITLLFGDEYSPAIESFQLLLPGVWFLSMASVLQNFIGSSGHAGAMVYGPLVAAVVNFFGNIIFIRIMGIEGAALASSVTYALFFVTSFIMIKHRRLNK